MKNVFLKESCAFCPRSCAVKPGFCREGEGLRLAWAGLHFGEEPPIAVSGGSGTVFVSGCNLRCPFCQNFQISHEGMGREVSEEEFSALCLALQKAGAENINIVTGSHAVAPLLRGLRLARKDGLTLPICWNCSGYETERGVDALSEVVDIWLPDMKTLDPDFSTRLFAAPNYPERASAAICRMVSHSPMRVEIRSDGKEKMLSGVLVRHLVMPGRLDDTRAVLNWFDERLRGEAELSLMTQYTPIPGREEMGKGGLFEDRFLTEAEYRALQSLLREHGFPAGFCQELGPDDEWLPDFNRSQPFSYALAKGIWHWKEGWLS